MFILWSEWTQELRRFVVAPRIATRVHAEVVLHRPDSQRLGAREQAIDGRLDALIRREDDEIRHSRTPLAKYVPRSTSPFQVLRRGCSLPRTIAVAPSVPRAKQRSC